MTEQIFRTPLYAAFFCATILTGCVPDQSDAEQVLTACPSPSTPISSVQGKSPESPMLGQVVTVQGIVTLIQNNRGLYMEEPDSDTDKRTSNAIFIQSADLADGIGPGTLISARGNVSEIGKGRNSLTALTGLSELIQCSSSQTLPLTDVTLPLNGQEREALEGMRIQIDDNLVATDVYQFGRGNFTLSGNGLQFVPTEVISPGPGTARLIAQNRANALAVMLPESMGYPELLISGESVDHISGVMAHDGRGMRLSVQSLSTFTDSGFTPAVAATAGVLRIVSMNLHNYFNGDGKGSGFPTPRGAKTMADFQDQRDRIGAAIEVLDPHVLAVQELENDGFGDYSAARDFIHLANTATGKAWAVTRPVDDNTGTDKISVAIFFRSDRLKPVGPAQTLTGPEFKRSRQPQAQLFQRLPDGGNILIVINHLKSKGSCPDSGENADHMDGQGCWNPVRLASAQIMSAWAKNVAASTATDNILILGDMNAYRNEDPIGAIREAGFKELMDQKQGQVYSFAYRGQHGTLDYAFSSDALLEKLQQAFIWHVNAALPAHMALPQPWLRFSDHDPVVVDIRSRQVSTSD